MKPKLIKDKKLVNLPIAGGSVSKALRLATLRSVEQGWKRAIVVAEAENITYTVSSKMPESTRVGMLEVAKHTILGDY